MVIKPTPLYVRNYKEGVELYQAGHYPQALESLKKAIVHHPDFPDAYFLIALIYDELGLFADSISLFQKLLVLLPNDLQVYHAYGKTLLRAGKEKQGLKILHKALKLNPKDAQIRSDLFQYYMRAQAPKKALALMEAGIRALPEHAPFYYMAGDILRKMKRLEQAQEYYELCLELDPNYEGAKRAFDSVIRAMESSAESLGEKSLDEEARDELVFVADLFRQEKYDSAIIRLLDLKNQAGVQKEASLLLGMAFAKKGLYKRAHDVFLAYIKEHESDIMVLYNVGMSLNRMGRYEEALDYLAEALERDGEYEEALCEMGIAHQMIGELGDARTHFVKALKMDRDDPRPYAQLARIAYDCGEKEKAAEFIQRAKSKEVACPEIALTEGYFAFRMGLFEECTALLEDCLRQSPDHFEALKLLGRLWVQQGEPKRAAEFYRAAAALNPADEECHTFLHGEKNQNA